VGEEDDKVQGGGVGPVEVLEHQQHRGRGRVAPEHGQRLPEHAQLRARRPRIGRREGAERAQGFDERLVGQLGPDQVDGAAEQHLEPGVAGTRCHLGREPGLADARLAGDERGRPAVGPRRLQGAPELLELAVAPDEQVARGSLHPGSIAPAARARKALVGIPRREDR
jgi:hypothetical protein